jgi:hypothetical protein
MGDSLVSTTDEEGVESSDGEWEHVEAVGGNDNHSQNLETLVEGDDEEGDDRGGGVIKGGDDSLASSMASLAIAQHTYPPPPIVSSTVENSTTTRTSGLAYWTRARSQSDSRSPSPARRHQRFRPQRRKGRLSSGRARGGWALPERSFSDFVYH